jgi:integration host factor subunit alpha
MTKAEIVQALYARVGGFSKKESADIVDLVFEMLKETLGKGEKIKISGFGNFVLRDKRQRPGRNPQTGDPIKISERRVLTFKASQILKQTLNPRRPGFPGSAPPAMGGGPMGGGGAMGGGPGSSPQLGSSHGGSPGGSNGLATTGSSSSSGGSAGLAPSHDDGPGLLATTATTAGPQRGSKS